MNTGVYCIRNWVNGKRYVGSASRSIQRRLIQHYANLRSGRHKNAHLQAAWNKYGEKSFVRQILCRCSPEECIEKEQEYIDLYDPANREYGYNIAPTAGSVLGMEHREDTKQRLRELTKEQYENLSEEDRARWGKGMLGKRHSEETRAKIAAAGMGRCHSDESKIRMSKTQKILRGIGNRTIEHRAKLKAAWVRRKARGWKHSDESRAKVSASLKGHIITEETREKIRQSNLGQKRSQETVEKIRQSRLGTTLPDNVKCKIGDALRGKKLSNEHCKKLKAAWVVRKLSNKCSV